MPETTTLAPASVLAGPHQSVRPLPVDGSAGFIDSRVLGVATAGYMGGDGLAPGYVVNGMALPEIAQGPSQIESALTFQVSYPDSNVPSADTNWVLLVPQIIPLGALVELEVATQSNPTVSAPGTPAGWNSRGSFHRDPVTGWFPRVTKFWRIKDDTWGGVGATVTVIWPSAVHPIATWKAWANVDTSSPYDVAEATANSSFSPFDPPAAIGPTVTANAVVTATCVGNIWPGGADSFNPSTQIPPGWTLTCSDHTKPRFSVCYHKRIASAGTTEDPPGIPIDPDQGIAITDVIRPALGQDLTCLLFVAVADETNTSWTGGTPPEIPARDEVQAVLSSLTSGTFTLTFDGQTTAGVAYNASAAAVQSALEALSNIAPALVYPGATGTVTLVGPSDNIQTAINAAAPGDVIQITGDHQADGTVISVTKPLWIRGGGATPADTILPRITTSVAMSGLWLSNFQVRRTTPVDNTGYFGFRNSGGALTDFRFFDLEFCGAPGAHGLMTGILLDIRWDNDRGVIHNVEGFELESRAFRLYCDRLLTVDLTAHDCYRAHAASTTSDVDAVNFGGTQTHRAFRFYAMNASDSLGATSVSPHLDGFQFFRNFKNDGVTPWFSDGVVFEDGFIDYRGSGGGDGGDIGFVLQNNAAGTSDLDNVTIRRTRIVCTDTAMISAENLDNLTVEDCELWAVNGSPATLEAIYSGTSTWGGPNSGWTISNTTFYRPDSQPLILNPPAGAVITGTVLVDGDPPDALTGWDPAGFTPVRPTDAEVAAWLAGTAPSGHVQCTGGALDTNPVSVEFLGLYGSTNVPLMTTNTADVAVSELVRGRAAEQFWAEGFANIPQSAAAGVPQAQIWALTPSAYPSGERIDFPISDHPNNHSFGAVLLVVADLDTANPLEDTFGTWETGTAATSADLGTITPVVPGSRIISVLAKAKAPGTYYPGEAPLATVPSRYNRLGTGLADAMTLDLFVSAPVPAATEVMPTVSWVGAENFLAASTTIRPAASAGSLNIAQALASGQGAWVELANAAGSLYEVVEFDATSIPADAILTGASIRFSHEADTRNALRVSLVGITADGSFQVASERRVGGYAPDPVGAVVTVDTGAFFEFSDGSHISEYTRLGALIWSTGRHPALSSHKLYELSLVLEYEPGGPVVSQVVGPNSPSEALEWVYSSGGGFPMTHSRVQIRTGFNEDPARVFADEYFTQFDSPPVGPDWELYDSDGNAGYGKRRPSAITNPINALAVSGTRVLQIEASNGTGADTGFVVSGGLKLKKPITYGEVEFRAWGTGDPDEIFSPVIILWPAISAEWPTEADVWPAGGELDIFECFGARDDLNPMETNIHRLALGAVPPFDASDDEVLQTYHAIDGTQPTKYIFRWLPEGLYLSIADAAFFPIVEDPLWIPNWPMEVTIQLDAWSNGPLTGGNNPKLLVDYLAVRRLITDNYPVNPLAPATGDIIYDSGWMAGGSRRSLVIKDKPLSRGNHTALVRAKARLTSGTEVQSKWAIDEFFDISGNPEASGAQTADPVFNPATGAVEVTLGVPGATTARAWLARSADQGLSWSLAGPFDVSPSSTTRILDLEAPLAEPTLRYQVSFDAGPMTETSAPVSVGTDISTATTSWFFIVPKDYALSTPVEVAGVSVTRPRRAQVAEDPGGSVVVSSPPLPIRMEMTLRSRDQATREKIDAILDSGETVRVVDIHGRSWWMKLATDIGEQMLRWAPLKTEHTGLRHAHEISFTLVETSKPV